MLPNAATQGVDVSSIVIGLMGGGGTGPELVDAAVRCLHAVEQHHHVSFELLRFDDERWYDAATVEEMNESFLDAATEFYTLVRERRGAILRGAVSAPVLYKLRERLGQTFKVQPVTGIPALAALTRFTSESLDGLRFSMVRHNTLGAFHSPTERTATGARMTIEHSYDEVERFARWSFSRARTHVALAMPTRKLGHMGAMWEEIFNKVAAEHPNIGYRQMYPNMEKIGQYVRTWKQSPASGQYFSSFDTPLNFFDVVTGPESFMDYLMDDVAWAIHGESFLGCSANMSLDGFTSYQTVHGTITPIRGKDMVNPIAMIHAVAMCLRDSCKLPAAADALEAAVGAALAAGLRTFDIHRGDARYELVGSRAMTDKVLAEFARAPGAGGR